MNDKVERMEESDRDLSLKCYSGIRLKGLRKATKKLQPG
jgi:hypothetical protein